MSDFAQTSLRHRAYVVFTRTISGGQSMRKLISLGAAALLASALVGGAQATPLSRGALATGGAIEQAMPDQGVIKARWHQRHYGWSRGYHYGWRQHHSPRYANYRGSRNFQNRFSVEH
jgi:hypothetical protein